MVLTNIKALIGASQLLRLFLGTLIIEVLHFNFLSILGQLVDEFFLVNLQSLTGHCFLILMLDLGGVSQGELVRIQLGLTLKPFHLNVFVVQLRPFVVLVRTVEMLKVFRNFNWVTLKVFLLLVNEFCGLRQEGLVQVVTRLLLSFNNSRIFYEISNFFLVSPITRVLNTTNSWVVLIENMLILTSWANSVWSRGFSTKESLGLRGKRSRNQNVVLAVRARFSVILNSVLHWQQIMALEEIFGVLVWSCFESTHGC